MRLASGLLVLTLVTTSILSGTFAKYVTSDSASDSARVAKFGAVVTASGSLFGTTYIDAAGGNTPGGAAADLTVVSSSNPQDNVVAPGTKNDTGITVAFSGAPEVDVALSVVMTDGYKEVFLKANQDLPDMTTGDTEDDFDNAADYYPVKFTLTQTIGANTTTLVNAGRLTAVETELEELSATIDANTDLATTIGTLTLTWAWDFGNSGAGTFDQQDTLLGDLAAGTTLAPAPNPALVAGTDYVLTTDAAINVTITQID
jgi:hypothetical protein